MNEFWKTLIGFFTEVEKAKATLKTMKRKQTWAKRCFVIPSSIRHPVV
ncbi:MAG: hypothetical protein M0R48_08520 [Candidatus Omnitrophica bacterium]|nr:hypothetical protein [Candidatus Omnitrophota bacterium]